MERYNIRYDTTNFVGNRFRTGQSVVGQIRPFYLNSLQLKKTELKFKRNPTVINAARILDSRR